MAIEFGKVEFVHPRDIWAHEADDFTPWLANNLSYVSDAIGIPLELVETEAAVERFSADILARDPDGGFALIENQLESSDHTHLGQILTYLAGLGARTVVWVARDFEGSASLRRPLAEREHARRLFVLRRPRLCGEDWRLPAGSPVRGYGATERLG